MFAPDGRSRERKEELMASSRPTRPQQVPVRLQATLLHGERTCPVTVRGLSEGGFRADGAGLARVGSEFSVEMDLPACAEPTWSPKAGGAEGAQRTERMFRAHARLLDV